MVNTLLQSYISIQWRILCYSRIYQYNEEYFATVVYINAMENTLLQLYILIQWRIICYSHIYQYNGEYFATVVYINLMENTFEFDSNFDIWEAFKQHGDTSTWKQREAVN